MEEGNVYNINTIYIQTRVFDACVWICEVKNTELKEG